MNVHEAGYNKAVDYYIEDANYCQMSRISSQTYSLQIDNLCTPLNQPLTHLCDVASYSCLLKSLLYFHMELNH